MASTSRKNLWSKNTVSTSRMKDLLKNVFSLYVKVASTLKNLKLSENIVKLVFTSSNIFHFTPSFNNSFY